MDHCQEGFIAQKAYNFTSKFNKLHDDAHVNGDGAKKKTIVILNDYI